MQKKKTRKSRIDWSRWISSLFSRKIKLQLLHNLALKLFCTSLRSTTPLRRINASHEERLSVCGRKGVRESYENTRGPYYEHWDKASSTYSTGPPIYEIRLGPVSPTHKDGVQGTRLEKGIVDAPKKWTQLNLSDQIVSRGEAMDRGFIQRFVRWFKFLIPTNFYELLINNSIANNTIFHEIFHEVENILWKKINQARNSILYYAYIFANLWK